MFDQLLLNSWWKLLNKLWSIFFVPENAHKVQVTVQNRTTEHFDPQKYLSIHLAGYIWGSEQTKLHDLGDSVICFTYHQQLVTSYPVNIYLVNNSSWYPDDE